MNEPINGRMSALDRLRGLAILLVFSGHYFYRFYLFKSGWVGLNLFFVLSGYLITSRLSYHLRTNPATYFRNFYLRRTLRIFPLYYGCLVIFFMIMPLVYPNYFHYFSSVYAAQGWYWAYASNWRQVFWGLLASPVLFHFWSLAVEEQFYVCWPILFRWLSGRRLAIAMAGIVVVSIGARILTPSSDAAYYSTLTACEPLLSGAGLYLLIEARGKGERLSGYFVWAMGGAVLCLLLIFYHNQDLHISNRWLMQYGYSAIDVFWAALLGWVVVHAGKGEGGSLAGTDLIKGLLGWLGRYAYGIYVYHWLILQLCVYKWEGDWNRAGMSREGAYMMARGVGIVLTLLVSFASYELYEKRWLRLKKYFER